MQYHISKRSTSDFLPPSSAELFCVLLCSDSSYCLMLKSASSAHRSTEKITFWRCVVFLTCQQDERAPPVSAWALGAGKSSCKMKKLKESNRSPLCPAVPLCHWPGHPGNCPKHPPNFAELVRPRDLRTVTVEPNMSDTCHINPSRACARRHDLQKCFVQILLPDKSIHN